MNKTKFYDNTRLSTHRVCNRKYFLRHRLHWAPTQVSPALVFGACWHKAQDVVWSMLDKDPDVETNIVVITAAEAFQHTWTTDFELKPYDLMDDDDRKVFGFRHLGTALDMLQSYVTQRRGLITSMKLLQVEQPFAVPIFPDREDVFYVGRLDKVVEWDGRIWVIEHKTSSMYRKAGGFAPEFLDSFSPNSQIDGYLHALSMLYPEKAKGVLVDAALVHGSVHDKFRLIPIERQWQQLNAWLHEAHHEVAIIENSERYLEPEYNMEKEDFLYAFPKNTQSCFNFFSRCPYHKVCRFIANPLQLTQLPEKIKVEKWEPYKELDLDKLGLEDEDV